MDKRIVTFGAIAIVIVAIIVPMFLRSDKELVVAIEEESAFEMSIDSAINEQLSSKANYNYGMDDIDMPDKCRIVHTETIQRHGARHLNKINKIEKIVTFFEELKKSSVLKDNRLVNWANELMEKERNNTGTICKTGEYEIHNIAKRLRERIHLDKDPSGTIIIDTTFKQRTQETRDAFLSGLLPKDYNNDQIQQNDYYTCDSIIDENNKVNETVFNSYSPLRFFSVCTQYQQFKNDEGLNNLLDENFKYNPEIEKMHSKNAIFRNIMNMTREASDSQKEDILRNMYLMCQFEASCYNQYNRTCSLLSLEPAIFTQLAYNDDVSLFLKKGPGSEISTRMACPLGRDIFGGLARNLYSQMEEGDEKKAFLNQFGDYFDLSYSEQSRLHLRFGHAESILPLYYLFIMKPPKRPDNRINFTGESFVPMSANFQFDMVECEGKYYVRMLANEVPIILDLPSAYDTTLYDLKEFLEQWKMILETNELKTCSYNDFVELCGDITCNSHVSLTYHHDSMDINNQMKLIKGHYQHLNDLLSYESYSQ